MNRTLVTSLLFAISATSACFAVDNIDDAFLLRQRPSDETNIRKLEFRDGSSAMLEIDALSAVGDDSTQLWDSVHKAVSDFVKLTHTKQRIHVRFYHSDYSRTKPSLHELHTKAKLTLADIDIYIVILDETVRNDHKLWSDYRASAATQTPNGG